MITLTPYQYAERARRRGLANQAREDRADLHRAYLDALTALEALKDAGIDRTFLDDTARGLHDALNNRDAALREDIDAEECDFMVPLIPAQPLDLADLEAFFEERA